MQPRMVALAAFTVVGMKCKVDMQINPIPQLWDDFSPRTGEIANVADAMACYGVCFGGENKEHYYIAGMSVNSTENLPQGMEAIEVDGGTYAVFEHHGALDNLMQTYQHIYEEWFPASEFKPLGCQDFEKYDYRFKFGQADSIMEIWVPVQAK